VQSQSVSLTLLTEAEEFVFPEATMSRRCENVPTHYLAVFDLLVSK
jgi:hypothetical protein